MGGSASLKMNILTHFFRRATLTRKLGQVDVVFVVWSEFISKSVHAGLHWLLFNLNALSGPHRLNQFPKDA